MVKFLRNGAALLLAFVLFEGSRDAGAEADVPLHPAVQQLEAKLGISIAPQHIFEVSATGAQYTTIRDALHAANDPTAHQVILVHSGIHEGAVTIEVDRTHLVGASRSSSRITGSLMASWDRYPSAIVDVQANDCSVSNITIRNTATQPGQRAALRIGNNGGLPPLTGFRCFRADLIAAQDTVWMQDNVVEGLVEDCYIEGTSDVACSSGTNNTYRRCHVKGDGTWAAFWCGQMVPCETPSQTNIIDCLIEKAAFGVLVARSHVHIAGCVAIPNTNQQGVQVPMPLYSTSSDNTTAYLFHSANRGFSARWKADVGDLCAYELPSEEPAMTVTSEDHPADGTSFEENEELS